MRHLRRQTFILLAALVTLLSLIFSTCSPAIKINETNYYLYETPPNGIKLAHHFYYDQSEISNVQWLEYMAWMKRIFGEASSEYIATYPDTNVWVKDSVIPYVGIYFGNAAFYDYPVVGITQKQANDFSIWRTDRVLEYLLAKHEIIKWDTAQTRDNHFTSDRYFKGEYKGIKPNAAYRYYFNFRLPTVQEWELGLHYADSVDSKSKKCQMICRDSPPGPPLHDAADITAKVMNGCTSIKKQPIYHLRGNVREWSAHSTISVGGSWKDSRPLILSNAVFREPTVNSATGFRNVIELIQWVEK